MIPDLAKIVNQLTKPLRTQVANLAARAVVRLVNDAAKIQLMQLGVGSDETRDGCERIGDYGFTSVPMPGAEAVVIFPNGRRDHGLVVAVGDRRYRITGLVEGEVALYTDEGDSVILHRGRTITVTAGTKVQLLAPSVEIGGGTMQPAVRSGELRTELDAVWSAIQTHVHPGVTAGPAVTGAPVVVKKEQDLASTAVAVRI